MTTAALRIVFFGVDGTLSLRAVGAIARNHEIVGVVRARPAAGSVTPRPTARSLLGAAVRVIGLRGGSSLASVARSCEVPMWEAEAGDDPKIAALVRHARPDVICIAGYPWLLRGEILESPPALTLNVHAALLPRHRGPLPLFWIYHADDRQTGVTVHAVTAEADAGAVLAQEAWPLARGFPVEELNRQNADRGAELLLRVLDDVAAGRTNSVAQNEAQATRAPYVKAGERMIDFGAWEVERVWHFCAGLLPRFLEPLTTADGAAIRYAGVAGYVCRPASASPGSVTPSAEGWDLQCRDGIVRLTR